MTDEFKRQAPGLIFLNPPCPLCGKDTDCDGDGYTCERCGFWWSLDRPEQPGQPIDEEAPMCGAVATPWLHSPRTDLHDEVRNKRYVCVLAAGHEDQWCRGVNADGTEPLTEYEWIAKDRKGGDQ